MSIAMTLVEKMELEFEERDGLFYSLVDSDSFGECVSVNHN